MPNKKISELIELSLVVGTNVLPIVDGGITKKVQASTLRNFLINEQTSVNQITAVLDSVYTSVAGASGSWNEAYTNLITNSAAYLSGFDLSFVSAASASWDSVYSSVSLVSSNWDSTYTNLVTNSAAYLSGFDLSFVSAASASWDSVYSSVAAASANWNDSYTILVTNSAAYLSGVDLSFVAAASANWNETYTNLTTNSAAYLSGFDLSFVAAASGNWNETYTNLVTNSAAYLSGVDLSFVSTASANWDNSYTNLITNSAAYLSAVDLSFVSAASANWDNSYTNLVTNSAAYLSGVDLSFVSAASANWDSVYSSVAANSANYLHTDFSNISSTSRINSDVTIFGNLSCTGIQTFNNTVFATTSALSVVHVGSGPAIYVGNNGTGDIASFYDIDQNIEVFHIGGNNGTFPNVGVKTSSPNKTFTVNGEISASDTIWDPAGNSTQWNSVHSSVATASANWNESYTTLVSNSAAYLSGVDLSFVSAASANWNESYTTLVSNSAAYLSGVDLSFVAAASGNWNNSYTTLVSNSAAYLSGVDLSFVAAASGSWNSTYTSVADTSANWNSTYSSVAATSANWDAAYSSIKSVSADTAHHFITCRTPNNQAGTMNTGVTPNTFTYTALGPLPTFDGVNLAVGDTILFGGQSLSIQNGPWKVVDAGSVGIPAILERPSFFSGTVKFGMLFSISKGTSFQGTVYAMFSSPGGITDISVGTTNVFFGICFTRGASNATNSSNTFTGTQTLIAGSATTVPLKFQAGLITTLPVAHSIEWDGTSVYATNSAVARKPLLYSDFSNVSSGPINLPDGLNAGAATFTVSLSSPALSGTHFGDGSNLTGIVMGGKYEVLENFVGNTPLAGGLSPTTIGGGSSTILSNTNTPIGFIGLVQLKTGTTQAISVQQGYRANVSGSSWSIRMIGSGEIVYATRFAQNGANWFGSNLEAGVMRMGLADTGLPSSGTEPTNGVYFRSRNGTSVELVCRQSNTESTLPMGNVSNGTYNAYKYVINSAGTSVEGFLNGVSQGTITTNFPTGTGLGLVIQFYREIVASPYTTAEVTANLDFYYLCITPNVLYV
jgi:hypothetical protein